MNVTWSELEPVVAVCAPIFAGLAALYFRLSFKINKGDKNLDQKIDKLDEKIETVRKEIKEDRESLRKEMREDRKDLDAKLDQKFDRIFEILAFRNPPPQRMHGHKPKGKSA